MARCRYGKLKNPSGGRRCKKRRSSGRRGSKVCRYGRLKHPKGKRVCRKRRGGGGRSLIRAQEAAMWKAYR